MEDEDYQKKPSSWPFNIIVWGSLLVTIVSISLLHRMSSDIAKTTRDFDKLFKERAKSYSTKPDIMRQMDRMHRTFQCCGADDFTSWYSIELYNPLFEGKWPKERENYLEWAGKCKKHEGTTNLLLYLLQQFNDYFLMVKRIRQMVVPLGEKFMPICSKATRCRPVVASIRIKTFVLSIILEMKSIGRLQKTLGKMPFSIFLVSRRSVLLWYVLT